MPNKAIGFDVNEAAIGVIGAPAVPPRSPPSGKFRPVMIATIPA
jgi:hypothetical protein